MTMPASSSPPEGALQQYSLWVPFDPDSNRPLVINLPPISSMFGEVGLDCAPGPSDRGVADVVRTTDSVRPLSRTSSIDFDATFSAPPSPSVAESASNHGDFIDEDQEDSAAVEALLEQGFNSAEAIVPNDFAAEPDTIAVAAEDLASGNSPTGNSANDATESLPRVSWRKVRKMRKSDIHIPWFQSKSAHELSRPPTGLEERGLKVGDLFVHEYAANSYQVWRCQAVNPTIWDALAVGAGVLLPGQPIQRHLVITDGGLPSWVLPATADRQYKRVARF